MRRIAALLTLLAFLVPGRVLAAPEVDGIDVAHGFRDAFEISWWPAPTPVDGFRVYRSFDLCGSDTMVSLKQSSLDSGMTRSSAST